MKVTGGILAGGEGRRFGGADKGLLELDGTSFVARVRDALAPQVDELIISANRNLLRYAALGHPVVTDEIGRGPAAGLLRLLETARHPWLICVPCDALNLPATLVQDFRDAQWAEEADIVAVHDGQQLQPTCCLVPTGLAPDLRQYLRDGHTALWRWQARHRLGTLRLDVPLANVNDADALAACVGARAQ